MIFRWERAPYTTDGVFADFHTNEGHITHRLYVKRTAKGARTFFAAINGRRIKGTYQAETEAMKAAETEAATRYNLA